MQAYGHRCTIPEGAMKPCCTHNFQTTSTMLNCIHLAETHSTECNLHLTICTVHPMLLLFCAIVCTVYVYVHTHIHICTYAHTHIYLCSYTVLHTYIPAIYYGKTNISIYANVYMHVYMSRHST